MPIQFSCPHCGHQTNVSDEYAGQTGPCSGCGKSITIPPVGQPAYYPAPAKSSSGPALVVIILAVVLGVVVVCGGILVALLLPAVQSAREAARRMQCTNNLKQIGLAMHNYHDTFKCFPPAYIPDEDGRPMHSWRVLILPYMEQQWLYDMYDFDEPWDSPENQEIADMMPTVFAYECPSDPRADGSTTNYVMIVGPGMISDGPTAGKFRNIADGTSNTILVVETSGGGMNWMEPRDLDASQISFQINNPAESGGIKSKHPAGANALLCDGSTRFLDDMTPSQTVKDMSTIAGGEAVPFGN